jgi:hypothetical protein
MKKEILGGLASGLAIVAVAFGARLANQLGYIDQDTVRRLSVGVIGLWLAWYGNRIPKAFAPQLRGRQVQLGAQIQRVAAWSMVLSGLVYAGLWAFAPISVAVPAGCTAVIAGIAVTFGYVLTLPARARAG